MRYGPTSRSGCHSCARDSHAAAPRAHASTSASAAQNIFVALNFNVVTWASFMATYGTVSKLGLFLIQYTTMRFIGMRRRRAQMAPALA